MTKTAAREAESSARFSGDSSSASAARRFVSETLVAWGCPAWEEIALLLVSEMVGNVVLHAGTDLDVRICVSERGLRVEVHDRNPRLPDRRGYSKTAATGRGLMLVEGLSRAWGAESTGQGKLVWFELDRPGALDKSVDPPVVR